MYRPVAPMIVLLLASAEATTSWSSGTTATPPGPWRPHTGSTSAPDSEYFAIVHDGIYHCPSGYRAMTFGECIDLSNLHGGQIDSGHVSGVHSYRWNSFAPKCSQTVNPGDLAPPGYWQWPGTGCFGNRENLGYSACRNRPLSNPTEGFYGICKRVGSRLPGFTSRGQHQGSTPLPGTTPGPTLPPMERCSELTTAEKQEMALISKRWKQVLVSFMKKEDGEMRNFLRTRTQCQFSCLGKQQAQALETLYRQIGGGPGSGHGIAGPGHPGLPPALTGAFRACYPSQPRSAVANFIDAALNSDGQGDASLDGLDTGVECSSDSKTRDHSKAKFFDLLNEYVDHNAWLKKYGNNDVVAEIFSQKSCQWDCLKFQLGSDGPLSAMWDSGIWKFQAWYMTASMTGAFRACYPASNPQTAQMFSNFVLNELIPGIKPIGQLNEQIKPTGQLKAPGHTMSGLAVPMAGGIAFIATAMVGFRLWTRRATTAGMEALSSRDDEEEHE